MNEGAAQRFAQEFLAHDLAAQVASCDRYELAPLFLELFRNHQPVLEAGCGSGRWNGWLARNGIRSDGVDWSEDLCARAREQMPECNFYACDMGAIPVPDGTYGGLMALGSLEHVPEGPMRQLREFHRVLRKDGVALMTVPYGGPFRRTVRVLQTPLEGLRTRSWVRRAAGKKPIEGKSKQEAAREAKPRSEWYPRFNYGAEGWFFYEYEFSKAQMREFVTECGFEVKREFVEFGGQGLLHTLGSLAGRWNERKQEVDYSVFGKGISTLFPASSVGHMLCYVLTKKW